MPRNNSMTARTVSKIWAACLLQVALFLPCAWSQSASRPSLENRVQGTQQVAVDNRGARPLLDQGQRMEHEQRWADALNHYEKALLQDPSDLELQRRKTVAQIHCDIARRYVDSSFVQMAHTLDSSSAQEIYSDVLLKIEAHHVDAPQWQLVAQRGTEYLDVALTKKEFLNNHRILARPEQVQAFRQELQGLTGRTASSRADVQAVANWAASRAADQLGIPSSAVMMEYVCGAIASLDEYSSYLTGSQLKDIYSQIEGNFVGLGVELKTDTDSLLILNVIPGGPADIVGIRPQDRITEVGGYSTKQISADQAAEMLKGERGSAVDVTIVSPHTKAPRQVRVRRERVDVPSVEQARILDPKQGVAYFRLTNFQKTTSRDVDAALWRLHREGMKVLIIDLRGNPGGLLTAAVDVADKFIDKGMIVATRGRSPRENFDYRAQSVGTWSVPLVVMIDKDSASASEILAGAIHDHQRGMIVGEQSYGKGSVQGIFPLSTSETGVRLTTALFYSPSGQQISRRGIQPNVLVHQVAKPVDENQTLGGEPQAKSDNVLQAAEEVARRLAPRQVLAQQVGATR